MTYNLKTVRLKQSVKQEAAELKMLRQELKWTDRFSDVRKG